MLKSMVMFLALTSVAIGNPPQGTTRTSRGIGGRETYYSKSGRFLGSSQKNMSGGRTYSDKGGVYGRSQSTHRGERFTPYRNPR